MLQLQRIERSFQVAAEHLEFGRRVGLEGRPRAAHDVMPTVDANRMEGYKDVGDQMGQMAYTVVRAKTSREFDLKFEAEIVRAVKEHGHVWDASNFNCVDASRLDLLGAKRDTMKESIKRLGITVAEVSTPSRALGALQGGAKPEGVSELQVVRDGSNTATVDMDAAVDKARGK